MVLHKLLEMYAMAEVVQLVLYVTEYPMYIILPQEVFFEYHIPMRSVVTNVTYIEP